MRHNYKLNKMKHLSLIAAMLLSIPLFSQTIKGRITDQQTNEPIYGANIKFSGKGGTTTDKEGTFYVGCSVNSQITVSYVGYNSIAQTIKNCDDDINISLVRSNNKLNEVEITATSNLNKAILYQSSSITKLEPAELKRGTGLFLDDAINGNVPGVTMNRRAVSSGQQFNIRGYGNGARDTRGISSNFDGQGYKVYLNGIPVTDAEGITTFDDIDYGSVGNVEVTKGPSGTLYGLAIAGVVNLSTIRPEKGKTSIGQEVLIGNYGLQRYTTQFQKGGEHSSLLVNYSHQNSDGFTIHNSSHKDFVNFVGDFQPNDKETVSTYFGCSNSYDQRSGELTIDQFNNNDFSGNIEYIKRNAHSQVYTFRAGVSHGYNFNEHLSNTTTLFGTGFNSNVSSAGGWTDKGALNFGLRSAFDTKFSLGNNTNLSGITGVETQRQNATTISYGMIDPLGAAHVWNYGDPYFIIGSYTAGNNGTNSNVYTTTATTSLFTEWTLALPHDFSITGGIGLSNMKITLDDRIYAPDKPTHYAKNYKNLFSPHLAINKVFSKQFSVYASYTKAYKAPVSSYFYIPYSSVGGPETGIVNSKLKPETGNQYEVGTKGALLNGKLSYQVALFDAIFTDKFTTIAVPFNATTTLYSYVVNGGKQDDKGIEALVKFTVYESADRFIKNITPFANVTYSDFEYKNYPFHIIKGTTDSIVNYNGNDVAGIAKVVANFGFDVTTKPGIYANMAYMYKDRLPITSDGLNIAPSYSLLNAKLGFRSSLSMHFDLDLYAGVNNITNTKYPIMVFVNQLEDAYIAGPRFANFYGGLNLKYNF